jgi:hypothetical protein
MDARSASVLSWQRTAGNRAVVELLDRSRSPGPAPGRSLWRLAEAPRAHPPRPARATTTRVQRTRGIADPQETTTAISWSRPTRVTPSKAGAKGGVILVTVSDGTFALKAAGEEAAAIVFGERVLAAVGQGGIVTPDSVPVAVASDEGQRIIAMLEAADAVVDAEDRASLAEKVDRLKHAKYVVVQKGLQAPEFGAEAKRDPGSVLPAKLAGGGLRRGEQIDPDLLIRLYNIGRTLAADVFIGNADRLDQINPGNIFLESKGVVGAIDTEAILQAMRSPDFSGPRDWAMAVTGGSTSLVPEGTDQEGMPSSNAQRTLLFDRWFTNVFRGYFELLAHGEGASDFPNSEEQAAIARQLAAYDWEAVHDLMRKGLTEGLADIAARLADKRERRELRTGLKEAAATYGESPNLNWHALKVKGTYMSAAASGADLADAAAQAEAEARYLEAWKPQIRGLVDRLADAPGDPLFVVPPLPPELSAPRKLLRSLTVKKKPDKEARELKEGLRTKAVDPATVDLSKLAGGGRRVEKAAFTVQHALVIRAYEERFEAIKRLSAELDAAQPGVDPDPGRRRARTIRRNWHGSADRLDAANGRYRALADVWTEQLKQQTAGTAHLRAIKNAAKTVAAEYKLLDRKMSADPGGPRLKRT